MVTPMLLLGCSHGAVIIFYIYVNWAVFCNFSKNGRSNGTYQSLADPGGCCQCMPPQQDPFLSFSHTFLPKSVRVGGWCPPQWEILDLPLPMLCKVGHKFQLHMKATSDHSLINTMGSHQCMSNFKADFW